MNPLDELCNWLNNTPKRLGLYNPVQRYLDKLENLLKEAKYNCIYARKDPTKYDIASQCLIDVNEGFANLKKTLYYTKKEIQKEPTDKVGAGISQVYKELNVVERTLIIGENIHQITSEPVWGFLKTLVDNKQQGKVTPKIDGSVEWKNSIDMLRRQIGKAALHQIVIASRGLYWLEPSVKVKDSGQIAIRKTKLARQKPL